MQLIYTIIRIYEVILIVRIFMSWVRPDPSHLIVQWIYRITEPVLAPIRRILPTNRMGIDFSPIVVFLLLYILKQVLIGRIGYR